MIKVTILSQVSNLDMEGQIIRILFQKYKKTF